MSALIPDEMLLVLLVAAGFCFVFRLRRLGGTIVAVVLGIALFRPFIQSAVNSMPWWVPAIGGIIIVLALLRAISAVFIGRNASDHMVGTLAADFVKALLFLPAAVFRWCARFFR